MDGRDLKFRMREERKKASGLYSLGQDRRKQNEEIP
jgi:hypothetical protein